MARTDTNRGVWKAAAGPEAGLAGVQDLTVNLDNEQHGVLNPVAINCLRAIPGIGRVVWGARTLRGADSLADEYKYIAVRRLALFIEESLYRGTQWVVFEPNDESLWSQVRLSVGAFMEGLFRQGAFKGAAARDAYMVRCDRGTMTQADIDRGTVSIVVGIAPLKPAEFLIIEIRQTRI
jgi:phage tail sheath protein FI